MLKHLAKLEHHAWMTQMKANSHVERSEKAEFEAFKKGGCSDFEKGYSNGERIAAKDILESANKLMDLINQIKAEYEKEVYMKEDVDLSGSEHIGQRIDKYA
ncbi:hypothetical protein [Cytobacillus oceanisediminis]|uniref:hypothetical protein n=1 Tax=Cytobacillus oceanisediminis TaxID=665099 RepID=UPI001C24339B|nr:hypothetical protein [Cytobacillus oceanisediminis]MBU8770287.1 hypothetical protein [Cytobacillus oceanisediminis]